jgi:hypothetical protein
MYLHLGQSVVIPFGDVVGIFDLDNASFSHRTRAFLRQAEERGHVINVSEELPKSFVLCKMEEDGVRVYISQLSSATLLRRAEAGQMEGNFLQG